jgi:hypothetical protein
MKTLFLERKSVGGGQEYLEATANRFGIKDIEVVIVRKDSKIIARGMHPDWGAVALKVVDPFVSDRVAFKALYADEFFAANPAGIFPRMYEFDLGYSISEWIHGKEVAVVDRTTMESLPVIELVEAVREWSVTSSKGLELSEREILSILRFYVAASIRRMDYRGASKCLMASLRFAADRRQLTGLVDEMASVARHLRLERGMMLTDLNPWNLIHDKSADRLVYVDLEPMRPGSFLFDAVFLLANMIIERMPSPLTSSLAGHLFSESWMPDPAVLGFFRRFASYLIWTYMTIDGQSPSLIRANVAMLQA